MKTDSHRKRSKHMHRRHKQLAAAMAVASILSTAVLPGLPAATAAASPAPEHKDQQPAAVQATKGAPSSKVPDNFKKVVDVKATAYAPGPHDNDQWGDKTYLGTTVRPGVIAVDPRVVPLGSQVYVQFPDGHGEYMRAEDTGGAIKGKRIDIAMSSVDKAQDFGIQNVKVFVMDKGGTKNA